MEIDSKKMVRKNTLAVSMVAIGMVLLSIGFASSFAVGSKYWEEKPILINPGETVDFFVVLQNVAGEGGDVEVQGSLTEGGDIASFVKEPSVYSVPFGSKKNVNLTVTISENVTVGETRNIVISFKVISGEGSGALGLGSSVERVIPIEIVKEVPLEKSNEGLIIFVLVGLLLLILVAGAYWFYKKKSK